MITTIIFDLDDTLYNEIDYCKSGLKAVARFLAEKLPYDASPLFERFWQQFCEGDRRRIFDSVLERLGIEYNPQLIKSAITCYRNHEPNICLSSKNRILLEQLRKKYKLGLLTDGFLPAQELKVKALSIESYFQCIIFTEKLGREYWKPSPKGFERLLRNLDSSPETAVYVADNELKDFIGPNRLGMFTIKFDNSQGLHKDESADPDAKADLSISELEKVPAILENR